MLYCWLLSVLSQNHRYTSWRNGAKLCHYQSDKVLWHGIIYQVQQICTESNDNCQNDEIDRLLSGQPQLQGT